MMSAIRVGSSNHHHPYRVRIGALVLAGTAALAFATPAGGATFRADSRADRVDANPGDGVCRAANGKCTLRAAVMEANHPSTPGPHVIRLRAGTYELRIDGGGGDTQGDLDVGERLRVVGAGQGKTTIRQTIDDRIFEVSFASTKLTLIDLKLTGGRSSRGGAIFSPAPLRLDRVTASGNRATAVSTATGGGAISVTSSLEMTRSRIVGNRAVSRTAGVGAVGGGLEVRALGAGEELRIVRSVISRNTSRFVAPAGDSSGGGLLTHGPGVIDRSTIAGNEAHRGGGLFHTGSEVVRVQTTTLSGNRAGAFGGALNAFGPTAIENSTLSGNEAGNTGSAINQSQNVTALVHATIARGVAPPAGAAINVLGGGTVSLRASIVAGAGTECAGAGTLSSSGYNVSSGATCGLIGPGDRPGLNPKLATLAANGGPTRTHALKPGSPARNAVAAGCPPPATDQRGAPRPRGPRCDAGSYEG